MQGLHLTADLSGCAPRHEVMTDPGALRAACLAAVAAADLTAVADLFYRYAPATGTAASAPLGITGVVLLAESHLAVHTWPELAAATLDVYVCNFGRDNSARARDLLARLVDLFAADAATCRELERGSEATAALGARASLGAARGLASTSPFTRPADHGLR